MKWLKVVAYARWLQKSLDFKTSSLHLVTLSQNSSRNRVTHSYDSSEKIMHVIWTRGKWSYHPNWNFGVKNFRITNFRLNNIFSTIFYGFDGFTARIFDILRLLLKCWEILWFHSNKAFSQYTDEYRANGQYDSFHMTHGMTHSYKMTNNHFREQESHESTRIFRAWSISWILIVHNWDKWTRLILYSGCCS